MEILEGGLRPVRLLAQIMMRVDSLGSVKLCVKLHLSKNILMRLKLKES